MSVDLKFKFFKSAMKLAMERTGHGAALGLKLTKVEKGLIEMIFPYKKEVIGNPITGVVHGGAIVVFSLYCGCSYRCDCCSNAAMDLRLDYMQPAEPEKPKHSAKVTRIPQMWFFVGCCLAK